MGLTQPLCMTCWFDEHPDILPTVVEPAREETCCRCAELTVAGIYTRIDPETVPYPSLTDDEREAQ